MMRRLIIDTKNSALFSKVKHPGIFDDKPDSQVEDDDCLLKVRLSTSLLLKRCGSMAVSRFALCKDNVGGHRGAAPHHEQTLAEGEWRENRQRNMGETMIFSSIKQNSHCRKYFICFNYLQPFRILLTIFASLKFPTLKQIMTSILIRNLEKFQKIPS